MSKRAFISHITEEAEVAAALKTALNRDFLGLLSIFVSSDGEGISAGDDWLTSIDSAIRQSALMLILCSPTSIRRPWINFEAGAAWMRQIPIIPLCHAGLTPRDLPVPLSLKQGLLLSDPRGLQRLYARVAKELECAAPDRSLDKLAASLGKIADGVRVAERDLELLDRDRGIKRRLDEALRHEEYKWRSLESVAAAAGVPEETAADFLRSDSRVRFGKGKSGRVIVGLRSRVG
jgi:TIR domain